MFSLPKTVALAGLTAAVLAAPLAPALAATVEAPKPKLVVVISIDQFSASLFEQYRADFTPHTSQRTWSAGKSLTATLVGRAVQLGHVKVDEAPTTVL